MASMIELVDPRGVSTASAGRLARRRSRAPARIGFLCNEAAHLSGPHFEFYSRVLETAFRHRFGVVEICREIKPTLSLPADGALLDRLSACDGVVNGLAK
jgi:hypothetical protein